MAEAFFTVGAGSSGPAAGEAAPAPAAAGAGAGAMQSDEQAAGGAAAGAAMPAAASPEELMEQLLQALRGSMSHVNEERMAAEQILRQFKELSGFVQTLLTIAGTAAGDGTDLAAAIQLRQYVAFFYKQGSLPPQEDIEVLREGLLGTLLQSPDQKVHRQLVLCISAILTDTASNANVIASLDQQLEQHWSEGDSTKLNVIVRCLKQYIRICPPKSDTNIASFTIVPRLFELMQMAGDAGLLETRKLVSGVICLWLASADVERFPLEPATLRHWCSILLGVITGPGSDDEDAAVFIWKAKARCFRSWSSIIRAYVLEAHLTARDLTECGHVIFQAAEELVGALQITLEGELPMDAESEESLAGKAYEKCQVEALEVLSEDIAACDILRDAYLQPRMELFLTSVLPRFLRLTPTDVDIVDSEPSEYASRISEEYGCEELLSCQIFGTTTARSGAMRAIRQLVSYERESRFPDYIQWVSSLPALAHAEGAQPDDLDGVSNRVAALRAFLSVADNIYFEPNPVAMEMVFRVVVEVLLPSVTAPVDPHTASLACVALARFFLFLFEREDQSKLYEAIQGVVNCLQHPCATVRMHASVALKDCLTYNDLEPALTNLAPAMLKWLYEQFSARDRGVGASEDLAVMEALLHRFPRQLGQPEDEDPRRADPAAVQEAVVIAHVTVMQECIARFHATCTDIQASDEINHALEQELGQYVTVIHALAVSCPKDESQGMYPQVVDQLLPYVNAAVAQGVLQQIVRAGTDAELVDALSTLPLGQRGVAEQLTQTLVTTLVTFPNMSEMLVRPLIMIMHSNPDLLLGVDEANKPMAHTYLLLHIVQRGFQTSSAANHVWVADLVRSVVLATSSPPGSSDFLSAGSAVAAGFEPPKGLRQLRVWFAAQAIKQLSSTSLDTDDPDEVAAVEIRLLSAIAALAVVDPSVLFSGLLGGDLRLLDGLLYRWVRRAEQFLARKSFDLRLNILALLQFLELYRTNPELPFESVRRIAYVVSVLLSRLRKQQELERRRAMVEGGLDPDDIEASLWDTRGGLGTAIGGDDTLDEQFEDDYAWLRQSLLSSEESFPELNARLQDPEHMIFMRSFSALFSQHEGLALNLVQSLGSVWGQVFTVLLKEAEVIYMAGGQAQMQQQAMAAGASGGGGGGGGASGL